MTIKQREGYYVSDFNNNLYRKEVKYEGARVWGLILVLALSAVILLGTYFKLTL